MLNLKFKRKNKERQTFEKIGHFIFNQSKKKRVLDNFKLHTRKSCGHSHIKYNYYLRICKNIRLYFIQENPL